MTVIASALKTCVLSLACTMIAACASTSSLEPVPPAKLRPNVLIIMADDLGYSDIGPYGGEIATPYLDQLARDGVRLTHFHSAPSCSPSRAMLLSGNDIHTAGLGATPEHIPPALAGRPGFEGHLTQRVATLAERLQEGGYATLMVGKWHMGLADGQRPAQRGFDDSFALLQGAHDHFGDGGFASQDSVHGRADYVLNDEPFTPPDGFYSSDAWTGWLLDALGRRSPDKPFFAFLSFTAPHSPLQAPIEDIVAQRGRYADGWARLAQRRIAGMAGQGVLPGKMPPEALREGPSQASWDALSPDDKAMESRNMEIYAAMVARMDANIGRVLAKLQQSGELDNTLIIFLSDNGPAGEQAQTYALMPGFKDRYGSASKQLDDLGRRGSFVLRSPQWARASSAPSRLFKTFVTEGGTLVPMIVRYPGLTKNGRNAVIGDMRDILPTVLDLVDMPEERNVGSREVAIVEGRSLLPWLRSGRDDRPLEEVAFEQYGQASVRWGQWKLIRMPPPAGNGEWALYDIEADPGESTDVGNAQPALRAQLLAAYDRYISRHGLTPASPPAESREHAAH